MFYAKNETGSAKIKDFIYQEIVKNDPNWQKRLTSYTAEALTLCEKCREPASHQINYAGQSHLVCSVHLGDWRRRGVVMGVRKL